MAQHRADHCGCVNHARQRAALLVEIIIGALGILLSLIGVIYNAASRTDRLLREIRDVLIQIRDK